MTSTEFPRHDVQAVFSGCVAAGRPGIAELPPLADGSLKCQSCWEIGKKMVPELSREFTLC